eukprot:TRINITY_DN34327_c0_g2_i1.p1 TRINITY_DN34327_c0_g2~~TRINITY_DN34327_c0_g2_i1.p1  ORF type:complete len:1077 (+),score=209.48 TRINITY_DN34327_c0_g2_i1:61-3291(+)
MDGTSAGRLPTGAFKRPLSRGSSKASAAAQAESRAQIGKRPRRCGDSSGDGTGGARGDAVGTGRGSASAASTAAVIDLAAEAEAISAGAISSAVGVASFGSGASASNGDGGCFNLQASKASSSSRSSPASASSRAYSSVATPTAAPSERDGGENGGAQAGVQERWFLGLGSKIVGVQHYGGVVCDRENVVLRRQPENPYDRNAIQVLNIRNEQIGHLPREFAAALAPMMDAAQVNADDGEELRFEGHVPKGAQNVFSKPLRISIFGYDFAGRLAPKISSLGDRLRSTYCAAARGGVEVTTSPNHRGTPVGELDERTWAMITGGRPTTKSRGPSMADVIERELESIFCSGARYEETPEAETPTGLASQLYPHQRKALHWMLQQERGLTVEEALAEKASLTTGEERATDPKAVSTKKAGGRAASSGGGSTGSTAKSKKVAEAKVEQVFFWTKEVSKNGTCIYKNLATHSAFKAAPRLPRGGILADDMGLGKTITTLALMLCDPPMAQTRDPASRRGNGARLCGRNLVVCPLSVLYSWAEQLRLHAPGLRVKTYHGPGRDRGPGSFANFDVIVTTYDIVRAEAKDKSCGLGAVAWHRAVLDEAHAIKGHRTATAQAVFDIISAERRWCLTGTPIQNTVEDIFSLSRFLRLEPFDQLQWFNRTIVRPLKSGDAVGFERLQVLLRTWCLRRTKDMQILDPISGSPRSLLSLPPKRLEVVSVPLDSETRVLYDKLLGCASKRVRELEKDGELGKNYTQVLSLLTRLRQLCCAPRLVPEALLQELKRVGDAGHDSARVLEVAVASLGAARVDTLLKNLAEAQDDDCSVCMMADCDVVTRCGHVFHRACMELVVNELGNAGIVPCPLCRQPVKKTEFIEKPPPAEDVAADDDIVAGSDSAALSAKLRAMLSFLDAEIFDKVDDQLGKPHKAIIFSQFTSILGLVQSELRRRQVPFAKLDGSMSYEDRFQALQNFSGHGHVQVILCSLKAAAVGLNLTVANHVLLLDPWWNPAIEDQAVDRAHRLGQRRPVRVLRYVAERTVEERILGVHAQKREIMACALSSRTSREELRQTRLNMVASIFEPF